MLLSNNSAPDHHSLIVLNSVPISWLNMQAVVCERVRFTNKPQAGLVGELDEKSGCWELEKGHENHIPCVDRKDHEGCMSV